MFAVSLSKLASLKQDESLFEKALEQFEKALKIQPDHANILGNYGAALLDLAQIKQDESLFEKAFLQYERSLNFNPNKTYNLACYYSLANALELCKANLLHAEQHNTLPHNSYTHLNKDKDLENIRNEPWFIELLERLKPKDKKAS